MFAVLLVRVDSIGSEYIRDRELPVLAPRSVDLPWLLLGPCAQELVEAINGVNALHDLERAAR